jgi:Polysaccharide biosynthesis enzyme WcbI
VDRVVVVGNCQAKALEMTLATNEEFAKRFEFVSFPAVHEISAAMVAELHGALAQAAIVLLQQVSEDYRDGIGLGTKTLAALSGAATVVRWPSVFWAGYSPDLFYLRDAAGGLVVDGPFDYHDRSILQAFIAGASVAETCRVLEDPSYPSDAPAWADRATAELDERGRGCDVQVTSHITSRFRDELLFFTMNHPTNGMLEFIAEQVFELIGVAGQVNDRRMPSEILGATFYPLHVNHVAALGLKFGAEVQAGHVPFKIRGVTHEPVAAVRAFFDYYSEHRQLAERNAVPEST